VRLGLVCTIDPQGADYVPQKFTKIYERTVEIPELPEGWIVNRVMLLQSPPDFTGEQRPD
jgi:hypothetical protein